MGISKPLHRIIEKQQQRLDEIANKRSPVAPGLDREGMPELTGVVGSLEELEENSRNRFSPRSAPPDVTAFDARVAELDARREEVTARLVRLRHKLANAPQADADAIAHWIAGGEKGARPASCKPALEEEIAELTRESDGLLRASSDVLKAKVAHVKRHRARLSKAARRRVDQAHARVVELIGDLGPAREQLVAAREEQLWAETYPSDEAAQMPQFTQLAGGDGHTTTAAGLTGVTPIARLHEALLADADWVTAAATAKHREIIDGRPQAESGAAHWAGSPEHEAALRAEREQYREAYKREWGHYPV
jgi:hypothetical protein